MRKKRQHVTLASFNIYPEYKRLHYRVHVWRTRDEMVAYLRASHTEPGEHCEAMVQTFWRERVTSTGRVVASPRCGDIHFYQDALSEEIISHEMAHATLGWARRIRLGTSPLVERGGGGPVCGDEERFFYANGRLNLQCRAGLREAGFVVALSPHT